MSNTLKKYKLSFSIVTDHYGSFFAMVSKKAMWISAGVTALVLIIITTVLLVVFLGKDSDEDEKFEVEETLVETSLGKINGSVFRTRLDKKFIGFRGIRYAEPPVDDLRFRVSF